MEWCERTELLVGSDSIERMKLAHVLVVGLGGVGAYAAEMLCRAGVGTLTIVDADTVNKSNINRQLIALSNTVGKDKAELMAERLRLINPDINLNVHKIYLNADEGNEILDAYKYDYVVDAIDTLAPKVHLISSCLEKGLPLVSSMGAGAKLAPEKIQIADISKSYQCRLAHMLRKRLHKRGIRKGFKVVFSSETAKESAMVECDTERNKKTMVGTISYLPAMFGCFCASEVIRSLIGEN